jgi:diacylglycerol kinase (ATP)
LVQYRHTVTQRLALLVNPAAGKRRSTGAAHAVAGRLRAGGADVTMLQGRDGAEAADLARKAVADEFDSLVAMGGDGLVHLALQAAAYSTTTLGVVPTGTGNDAARSLGLPRSDPLAAADVVVAGHTRCIDLGRVGGVYYASVLSTGFDSLVNERANAMRWPRGQMRYNLATVAELRVLRPLPYVLEFDGEEQQRVAVLVAVGNGPSYGGGLRMCEGALVDDGLLDVVIIKPITKLELLRVYPRLFTGTHVHHPAYEHRRVKRVSVAAAGIVAYADGERLGPLPVTAEVAASALTVYSPPA